MNFGELAALAEANVTRLRDPYPGRGIILGITSDGLLLIQVFWMMGRKWPSSRNRLFCHNDRGKLWTEIADKTQSPADTSLTLYEAMKEDEDFFVVSNGHHTADISKQLYGDGSFWDALRLLQYEPDLSKTPRIAGVCSLSDDAPTFQLGIVKPSPLADASMHQLFAYDDIDPGFGYCVTTYAGDGEPLPAFEGEPFLVPLFGSPGEILEFYRRLLNDDNCVAVAVKAIEIATGKSTIQVKNKYLSIGVA